LQGLFANAIEPTGGRLNSLDQVFASCAKEKGMAAMPNEPSGLTLAPPLLGTASDTD
jgi:hypothetical protein